MEKSGLIQITQEEFDLLFSEEKSPMRILSQWGITLAELKMMLASGQYEIV